MELTESPEVKDRSPVHLFFQDVKTLLIMSPYIIYIMSPFSVHEDGTELQANRQNIVQKSVFGIVSIVQFVGLLLLSLLLSPPLFLIWLARLLLVKLPLHSIQGPREVRSDPYKEQAKGEKWIFLNGIASGKHDVQQAVNAIADTFGRPVDGVHNETVGFLGDLVECIIQRSFSYCTPDVRFAYAKLKSCLIDPNIHTVVLIAHSQGGIIASMVLDRLFCEIPHNMIAKLEVYTFGSAADHFNNPITSSILTQPISDDRNSLTTVTEAQPGRIIKHIEHYVNEKDMVPRWGVLHSVHENKNDNLTSSCGRVFVRRGTGHLFCQHYLFPMFPFSIKGIPRPDEGFLNKHVNSNFTALSMGDGSTPDISSSGSNFTTTDDFIYTESTGGTGQTVKELSRLWRYVST